MNENINKKFDVKNFDYDKCYEEVKENASKNINIIVCGATGVGKSSLINDFFEFDKDSAAPVGISGKPQTRKLVYAGKQRFLQKYNRSYRRTQK